MKRHGSRFVLLLAGCAWLAACAPPGEQSGDQSATTSLAAGTGYASSPQVASIDALPSVLAGPADRHTLDVLVSPTCNHCELMTLGILDAAEESAPWLADTRISFTIMPRKDVDVQIISGFMCIPSGDRPAAIVDYCRRLNENE